MARICGGAQVVLNIHTWFGRWDYGLNPRVFEACGYGAFQLVDWKREMESLFGNTEDGNGGLVAFRTVADLKEKLRYYLNAPEERAAIAARGHRIALERHTYHHRMREALAVMGFSVSREDTSAPC